MLYDLRLSFLSIVSVERRRGVAAGISMVLVGTVLEASQRMVPGRTPDLKNALASCLGILSGITLGLLLVHRRATMGRD